MLAAPAANVDAEFSGERRQAALQRAEHARRDAGGMPIHSHHRAEALEPKGMREPAQELVAAIFVDDRFGDHSPQPGHPIAKPFSYAAPMERKICAAGAVRHQSPPVTATAVTVSGGCAIATSPAKTPAGGSSKFETVTPSSRMPLTVGK